MIWPADVEQELVPGSGTAGLLLAAPRHVPADAGELPHRFGSNVIMSNLFNNNRADRFAPPEAVAPGDTIGHD